MGLGVYGRDYCAMLDRRKFLHAALTAAGLAVVQPTLLVPQRRYWSGWRPPTAMDGLFTPPRPVVMAYQPNGPRFYRRFKQLADGSRLVERATSALGPWETDAAFVTKQAFQNLFADGVEMPIRIEIFDGLDIQLTPLEQLFKTTTVPSDFVAEHLHCCGSNVQR